MLSCPLVQDLETVLELFTAIDRKLKPYWERVMHIKLQLQFSRYRTYFRPNVDVTCCKALYKD